MSGGCRRCWTKPPTTSSPCGRHTGQMILGEVGFKVHLRVEGRGMWDGAVVCVPIISRRTVNRTLGLWGQIANWVYYTYVDAECVVATRMCGENMSEISFPSMVYCPTSHACNLVQFPFCMFL